MDGQYLVYAIVAGALLAAIALLQTLSRGELSRLKVQPKPLMTPPERRVCLMIERALPGARIHAQVSMGAIMNPAKGLGRIVAEQLCRHPFERQISGLKLAHQGRVSNRLRIGKPLG